MSRPACLCLYPRKKKVVYPTHSRSRGVQTGESWLNSWNQVIYQATYSYDAAGNLIEASDPNAAYSYSYDGDGRLTQQVVTYPGLSPNPLVTLSYGYDGFGDRTSLADSLGGQITYSYNGNFQLTGLTMSLSGTLAAQMTFSYDSLGRLAGVSRWAGVGSHVISSSYSYDGANRLTGISYADATTGTPLASFAYGYNADGQVTSYTGPEGTLNYSYDKDGELTGVSGAAQATYSYDANGNRTLSGYQTGPGNALLSDGQFTYTYDKDGNLLSKRDASGDVWSYSWDYRNRLTEVKETNAQNQVVLDETFQYDVNNNLIGEAVNGVPQRWTVYDGSTPYLDLTGAGQVSERYLADPNALAQYWARVGVTGQADWMVTDLLGSVRALVSASGSVEDQIAYDAYGNVVSETNAAAGGRLKYAGGQYDSNLQVYVFSQGWYTPSNGRWDSPNSLGVGLDSNPYRYKGNDPMLTSLVPRLSGQRAAVNMLAANPVLGQGLGQTGQGAQLDDDPLGLRGRRRVLGREIRGAIRITPASGPGTSGTQIRVEVQPHRFPSNTDLEVTFPGQAFRILGDRPPRTDGQGRATFTIVLTRDLLPVPPRLTPPGQLPGYLIRVAGGRGEGRVFAYATYIVIRRP
jgi:RHS repeat-associated protein